jgi:asparagine synthase (glutamine-hydrolysing)
MCGIAGKVDFAGGAVGREWLGAAVARLAHRGPDGAGMWESRAAGISVGLGHRRLRIIDLDPLADQPMHNTGCVQQGRATPLAIVFNGEIYNYAEIRRELLRRGHLLTTQSDTEVILHLYEEEGAACVRSLRGMFAFAIWDSARRSLFCARDRVGKKPLYYRRDGSRFWFASEPGAILCDPAVSSEVDPRAIAAFLTLGYVPSSGSAFASLRRLAPAHTMTVGSDGLSCDRYWTLDYEPKSPLNEVEAVDELRRLLRESVRLRLVSDVPVGAFLSGGVDSASVVATAVRESGSRLRTFSIGFDDPRYNELAAARVVAERYDTDHHEFVVRPDAAGILPELACRYGEPYADSSAVPTYYLSRLARQHITVAINGDGGDESFAGYRRYRAHAMAERAASIPGFAAAARYAGRWLPNAGVSRSALYDANRFLAGLGRPAHARYAQWFGLFEGMQHLFGDVLRPAEPAADPLHHLAAAFERHADLHPVDRCMAADVALYLPDDLLVKVDIATMAHGLEARSPLLDHRLMEFAARLPVSLKLRGGRGKYVFKRAVTGIVPEEVLRRPKTGFGVPLDSWFREDLKEFVHDVLSDRRTAARGYFRPGAVRSMLDEHMSGRRAHGHRLWALLMLEYWHRSFIDREALLNVG